jgi:hypothetical protein
MVFAYERAAEIFYDTFVMLANPSFFSEKNDCCPDSPLFFLETKSECKVEPIGYLS